ncbi:MAG: amidohydrolase [Prevotella sp.]|nr:amidohydrolase [Candidatus Equicola faecalis]
MEYFPIIDAHAHLWLKQEAVVNGSHIHIIKERPSRSMFFGEEVQMLPPFMIDGKNSAEVFLSNMDYAQVSKAVIVQEIIDGNQDVYLEEVERKYPQRFICCGMIDGAKTELLDEDISRFSAFAMPAHRITARPLTDYLPMFKQLEKHDKVLDICLADDERQIAQMQEVIEECPRLRVAIGHFGMATTASWKSQILLARNENVMIESGGITWLYHSEFYPYPSAIRAIKEAADMVGMKKLMWGSDYPRTITAITYRMSYDFVSRSKELTHEEKEMFLGENAKRFYRLSNLIRLPYIKNMSE